MLFVIGVLAGTIRCGSRDYGGKVWESNPPEKLLTPHAGFEDQREHQNPSFPIIGILYHGWHGADTIEKRFVFLLHCR